MVTDDGANTENTTTKDIDAMKKMLAERFAGLDDPKGRRDTSKQRRFS